MARLTSLPAAALYAWLCEHADYTTGSSRWSLSRIATDLGVARSTVIDLRAQLAAAGLITIRQRSAPHGGQLASAVVVAQWTPDRQTGHPPTGTPVTPRPARRSPPDRQTGHPPTGTPVTNEYIGDESIEDDPHHHPPGGFSPARARARAAGDGGGGSGSGDEGSPTPIPRGMLRHDPVIRDGVVEVATRTLDRRVAASLRAAGLRWDGEVWLSTGDLRSAVRRLQQLMPWWSPDGPRQVGLLGGSVVELDEARPVLDADRCRVIRSEIERLLGDRHEALMRGIALVVVGGEIEIRTDGVVPRGLDECVAVAAEAVMGRVVPVRVVPRAMMG